MNLNKLIDRAAITTVMGLAGVAAEAFMFGGDAPVFLLLSAVVGGLSLHVLLLAVVASATVNTLKKKEK